MDRKPEDPILLKGVTVLVVLVLLALACVVEGAPVVAYLKYIFS